MICGGVVLAVIVCTFFLRAVAIGIKVSNVDPEKDVSSGPPVPASDDMYQKVEDRVLEWQRSHFREEGPSEEPPKLDREVLKK